MAIRVDAGDREDAQDRGARNDQPHLAAFGLGALMTGHPVLPFGGFSVLVAVHKRALAEGARAAAGYPRWRPVLRIFRAIGLDRCVREACPFPATH